MALNLFGRQMVTLFSFASVMPAPTNQALNSVEPIRARRSAARGPSPLGRLGPRAREGTSREYKGTCANGGSHVFEPWFASFRTVVRFFLRNANVGSLSERSHRRSRRIVSLSCCLFLGRRTHKR